MEQYENLFSPLKVGSIELKNRIVFPPHSHVFPKGSEQYFRYYEARAQGGTGAITLVGELPKGEPWPSGFYIEDQLACTRRTVEVIHKHGAKAFIQTATIGTFARGPSYSSAVPHAWGNIQTREYSTGEIDEKAPAFGELAKIARSIGIDGLEMLATHSTGIHQLLSPIYNYRKDKYGGSLENRMRLLLDSIDAIRQAVGRDLVVGVRIDGDESAWGGHSVEDTVEICKILEATGQVDYLSVDIGIEPQESYMVMPSCYMYPAFGIYAAAAIRSAVNIPVLGVGRITSPEMAERVLQEGGADMVGICKAQIADPEWANKARSGARNQIRECLGDVEGCVERTGEGRIDGILSVPMGCTVNPDVGREGRCELIRATKTKNVVIVGAGLAGMQAAMIATKRGHKVTVLEKEAIPGGHVNWVAKLPGKADTSSIGRWLDLQLKDLGVDVRLNTLATAEMIHSLNPDAVIIATGACYDRSGISTGTMRPVPGADADYVLTPEDVLKDGKEVGQNVVIYDDTGYIVGPGLAEMLADQGKQVEFVTSQGVMVSSMISTSELSHVLNLRVQPKATVTCNHVLRSIENHTVTIENVYTDKPRVIEGVDTVIMLTGKRPNEALFHELLGKMPDLHIIGDAFVAPLGCRAMDSAIKAGDAIGRAI